MDLAERERAYIRFSGGPTAVVVNVLDRCQALEARGLSHDLARTMFESGNVSLLCDFEALTDDQLAAVTAAAAGLPAPPTA